MTAVRLVPFWHGCFGAVFVWFLSRPCTLLTLLRAWIFAYTWNMVVFSTNMHSLAPQPQLGGGCKTTLEWKKALAFYHDLAALEAIVCLYILLNDSIQQTTLDNDPLTNLGQVWLPKPQALKAETWHWSVNHSEMWRLKLITPLTRHPEYPNWVEKCFFRPWRLGTSTSKRIVERSVMVKAP